MPKIAADELREFVIGVFRAAGASANEARVVGEHLVEANLAGVDSHGVCGCPGTGGAGRASSSWARARESCRKPGRRR